MQFLHLADIHLGHLQYNSSKRFNDFGRAFARAVDLAIAQPVAVCVIAGDFFHKAAIDPITLAQAEEGLARLRDAAIPVLIVHGNHDKARYQDRHSWVDYLATRGLVHLLSPVMSDPLTLAPGESYTDIDGVRFIGVPWWGAAAPHILAEVAEACASLPTDGIHCTVLITHAGMEGQMPHIAGGLKVSALEPLRAHTQYIALGHIHKPYSIDDWIYNPGSLEACNFSEALYDRGAYLVTINPDGTHHAEHIKTAYRPFQTIRFSVHEHKTPQALLAALETYITQDSPTWNPQGPRHIAGQPVVRLILEGGLAFERTLLDVDAVRGLVIAAVERHLPDGDRLDTTLVRVENRAEPAGFAITLDESISRQALEQHVMEELVRSSETYSAHAPQWSQFLLQIKHEALNDNAPQDIYTALDRHLTALDETP